MFLARGEAVGSRIFPVPVVPPVFVGPDDNFLNSGTELTTQKYSTNRGTFSLSRALDSLVMRRRVSADPPGLLIVLFVPLLERARLRSFPNAPLMVPLLDEVVARPSWLDVRVRARRGPPPPPPVANDSEK